MNRGRLTIGNFTYIEQTVRSGVVGEPYYLGPLHDGTSRPGRANSRSHGHFTPDNSKGLLNISIRRRSLVKADVDLHSLLRLVE
jgi:hypothetical protein